MERPRDIEKGGWMTEEKESYSFDAAALTLMNAEKSMDTLKLQGGVEGIAKRISTDVNRGIEHAAQPLSQQAYGFNRLPEKPGASFFALLTD